MTDHDNRRGGETRDSEGRDSGPLDREERNPGAPDPEDQDLGETDAPLWAKLFLTVVPFLLVALFLYSDSCWGGSG